MSAQLLKECSGELAEVIRIIFNWSVRECRVPKEYKKASVTPLPKKSSVKTLNDYRPIAITSWVIKVFEGLILRELKSHISNGSDEHQFAYRNNRGVEDAVATLNHTILQHLENKNTYARVLFLDFSSAFNTIIPSKL